MSSQKIIIESLSMDLLRIALGLHRGSTQMANRFKEEALKRQCELEKQNPNPYIKKLLAHSKIALKSNDPTLAEDILMYSILFQNFARKYHQ